MKRSQFFFLANTIGTSPSSGGGSFRIREGNIEEEEKSGTVSKGTEWNDFLKSFLESPDSLPCRLPALDPNDPESSGTQGRILIGNTSQKEYDRVRNNPDSMGSAGSVTTGTRRLGSVRFNNGRIIR